MLGKYSNNEDASSDSSARGQCWVASSTVLPLHFWDRVSQWSQSSMIGHIGHPVNSGSASSVLGLQLYVSIPGHYLGARCLNSGHLICSITTLPIEASLSINSFSFSLAHSKHTVNSSSSISVHLILLPTKWYKSNLGPYKYYPDTCRDATSSPSVEVWVLS